MKGRTGAVIGLAIAVIIIALVFYMNSLGGTHENTNSLPSDSNLKPSPTANSTQGKNLSITLSESVGVRAH